jgi:hypothetical protein
MTNADATKFLQSRRANEIIEAATYFYGDVAGADWDGSRISTLRNGQWYRHSEAANPCIARTIINTKAAA